MDVLSLKVWMTNAFGFVTLGVAVCQYLYIDMKVLLNFKEGILLQVGLI